MKIRRGTLALCCAVLLPALCATAELKKLADAQRAVDNLAAQITTKMPALAMTSSAALPKSTRAELGTKDAPVDGKDGKPHDGPFVDRLTPPRPATAVSDPTHSNQKPKAEDGVMNDQNRVLPKEGTTGTEGGVSEKARGRVTEEQRTGTKQYKTPDSPKEPHPVPAVDKALVDKASVDRASTNDLKRQTDPKAVVDKVKAGTGAILDKVTEKANDAVAGVGGLLQKPTDLPDRPHDIPHPEPVERIKEGIKDAKDGLVDAATRGGVKSQAEGAHDLIPWDSLFGSFSSIAATEIGDKTFIVAALMAMRYPRFQVFTAAYSALFIMTILSGVAGHLLGAIISKKWAALGAAILFLVFGVKSLREGSAMSPGQGVAEEMQEVEAELEEKEVDMARRDRRRGSSISAYALESGRGPKRSRSRSTIRRRQDSYPSRSPSPSKASLGSMVASVKNLLSLLMSPAWVETFSMTFVGELGDRSQIATVAMAAGQEYYWVMVGSGLAHFVCTAIAVLGGSALAGRVSMRNVTLVGGAIFIFFGIFTLYEAKEYFF